MNTSSNMYQFHYAIKHTVRGGCGGGTGNGMAVVCGSRRACIIQSTSQHRQHRMCLCCGCYFLRNWTCSIYDKLIWCDLILMVTIASLVGEKNYLAPLAGQRRKFLCTFRRAIQCAAEKQHKICIIYVI